MKTLLVVHSGRSGNTRRLAETLAAELDAAIADTETVNPETLADYDLVGFGSGVYRGKLDTSLHRLVERLPERKGARAFIFSTAGTCSPEYHATLRDLLESRGFEVVGEHCCPGEDSYRFPGTTLNRECPTVDQLADARAFARSLLAQLSRHDA